MTRLTVIVAALAVLGAVGLALDSVSPLAMDKANRAYIAGEPGRALRGYEAIADGWHTRGTRAVAAERAALLDLQRGEDVEAIGRLRQAAGLSSGPDATRLQRRLADVYEGHFDDPRRAAMALREAARGSDDPRLLVEAARAFERAGAWTEAGDCWTEALPGLAGTTDREEAEAGLLRVARHSEEASTESE